MKLEDKVKSLFQCLPLDNNGIIQFKNFIKNNSLEKRFFYEKNDKQQTLIEALLNLGIPKTIEEGHIRVHLLYNFYIDSLDSSFISKDLHDNLRKEYISNIYKKYEKNISFMSNPPKFNLNEYFKQIKLILEESTTKENATHDINKILNNYFLDFNSQISIAQTALLMKVYENIFSPQSKEKSIKDNLTDIGYHLSDFTKEFFAVSFFLTNTFSACFPKLINKVINPKDIKEIGSLKLSDQHNLIDNMWSDEIALSSLESLVSKYLMNNKVKAEYESLSAELKNEKKPIVRLKFMPKIKDNTIQEAEKNKRTKI